MKSEPPTNSKKSDINYEQRINEAFYNSDFKDMTKNLQEFNIQEAKKHNSKRTNSRISKENYSNKKLLNKFHHQSPNLNKLTREEQKNILKNKDFNFELDQEYLESRYLAYQSKDLHYSLKNAKAIEKSLMEVKLEDSDQRKSNRV